MNYPYEDTNSEGSLSPKFCGSMAGSGRELGDIVGPSWTDGPSDAELGIAYHGKSGPVYWVNNDFSEEEEA